MNECIFTEGARKSNDRAPYAFALAAPKGCKRTSAYQHSPNRQVVYGVDPGLGAGVHISKSSESLNSELLEGKTVIDIARKSTLREARKDVIHSVQKPDVNYLD